MSVVVTSSLERNLHNGRNGYFVQAISNKTSQGTTENNVTTGPLNSIYGSLRSHSTIRGSSTFFLRG